MNLSLDVIGIGHVTSDIVCPFEKWPETDTKTILPGLTLSGGGPTANAMAALARLGVACGLVGKLGDDLLGRFAREAHASDGIDISHLQIDPGTESPVSVILCDLTRSTRTILLTKGRGTTLDPATLDHAWLRQARVIHFDGHQMPASLAVARAAKSWPGARTVLDAGSMKPHLPELIGLCDVVFASARFMRELTGGEDPERFMQALHELGAPVAGVTLGARGSMLSDGKRHFKQPAFEVAAKDTTGAGDAFHGGLIYGLLHGLAWDACLRIASSVAAIKCTGLGARSALPGRDAMMQFMAERQAISQEDELRLFR